MATSLTERFLSYVASGRHFFLAHKLASIIGALFIIGIAWWGYKHFTSTTGKTTYTFGTVTRSTIVASVSESGQISASQELSLTPQVSGQIIYVGVKPGQHVTAGTLIAEIDPTSALQSVRSAELNVQSAQNALASSKLGSQSDISKARSDATTAATNLPRLLNNIGSIVTTYDPSSSYLYSSYYNTATAEVSDYVTAYHAADLSDPMQVKNLIDKAFAASQALAEMANKSNAISHINDQLNGGNQASSNAANTALSNLSSDVSTVNGYVSSFSADSVSLAAVSGQGLGSLSSASAELDVTKARESLAEAQHTLSEYYIHAPFDGVIGTVSAQAHAQSSGAVATMITNQRYVDISVNEVDAAKLALGDKATVSFTALPDLTLTGTVAELNPVGTVTQGVVSYAGRIALDAQNPQVQPGMSVTVKIIIKTVPDALVVPSSAVKTQSGQSYVMAFPGVTASSTPSLTTTETPTRIPVEIGATDGVSTQILSGLSLGDTVVTRSASASTAATPAATTGTGGARSGGNAGFGGGAAFRAL